MNPGKDNFLREVAQENSKISLVHACLFLAQTADPELVIETYLDQLASMATTIEQRLPTREYPLKIIQTINQYLFKELGFKGNQEEYYDPRNSFLNQVIDRRLGIPITLSVVYLDLARRLEFPMVGIGMPGHFLIRPQFEGVGIFVDPFHQGDILFPQDCQTRLKEIYQQDIDLTPEFLNPVNNKEILGRILTNLKFIYLQKQDFDQALAFIELHLGLFPEQHILIRDKGLVHYQLGQWHQAWLNLELYLSKIDPDQANPLIISLLQQLRNFNY